MNLAAGQDGSSSSKVTDNRSGFARLILAWSETEVSGGLSAVLGTVRIVDAGD
jgi:hypothetical protein